MKSLQYLVSALAVTFIAGCASQTGQVQNVESSDELSIVQGITLSEKDNAGQIHIQSTKELKYNIFKLTDPERIMIDLIDARLGENVPLSIPGNNIVQEIKAQPIKDSISTLVRLEVDLNKSANYLAGAEGDNLVVRLLPLGEPVNTDENFAEAPPAAAQDNQQTATDSTVIPPLPEAQIETGTTTTTPAPKSDKQALASSDQSKKETAQEKAPEAKVPTAELPPLVAPLPAPKMEKKTKKAAKAESKPEKKKAEEVKESKPPLVPVLAKKQEKKKSEKKVIVEPEPAVPVPHVATQEIPTSELTKGTSLLSGMGSKVYTGKKVSLEFQDASIQDVIRLIADVSKLNIIIADDVKGKITLKLVDVPWDQALDIILTSKGLDKVQEGNIFRVAPIESLKKEREIALANDKAAKQLEPLKLKLFNVNYAKSSDMSARIKNLLSGRGSVDTDSRTNTLIVKDIAENLSRVENLIKVLDTQTPQVRIESRIVQANDSFTRSIGVQWGPTLKLDTETNHQTSWQFPKTMNVGTTPDSLKPVAAFTAPDATALTEYAVDALGGGDVTGGELGFRLGSVSNIFNLDLHLQYAENQQLARVVSRPSITVLDNKTARIIQGSRIPFLSSSSNGSSVQFQEAGIEISVTPQITNDGSVILNISTRSNEPGSESVGGNPIINIREAQTDMLVKSGRTAVLGGVFKTSLTKGDGGVPGLMDIPIVGWLFKGESKSNRRDEMLIFITPYILSDTREAQISPDSSSDLNP